VKKTNERIILEAAKRLNYPLQQNVGTHLRQEDLFIALVLVTDFHIGEFNASFYNGFVNAGRIKNIDVSLFNTTPDVEEVCSLLNRLANADYSSAVLFVTGLHSDDYKKILEQVPDYFPLISCSNINHPVMDTVTFDAYRGANLVADHFINKGF